MMIVLSESHRQDARNAGVKFNAVVELPRRAPRRRHRSVEGVDCKRIVESRTEKCSPLWELVEERQH